MDKRCYSNRKEYLKEAVKKRRRVLQQKAIDYKGGVYEICSYDKCADALEFHHVDSSTKDTGRIIIILIIPYIVYSVIIRRK